MGDPELMAKACALANANEPLAKEAEGTGDPATWARLAARYVAEADAWEAAGHRDFAARTRRLAGRARINAGSPT